MDVNFPFFVLALPTLVTFILFLIPAVKSKIKVEYYYKALFFLFVWFCFGSLFAMILRNQMQKSLDMAFSGVVEKVYYEKPKHIPYITVKGREYGLSGLNYDTIIVGDSAIKKRGSSDVQLIRRK